MISQPGAYFLNSYIYSKIFSKVIFLIYPAKVVEDAWKTGLKMGIFFRFLYIMSRAQPSETELKGFWLWLFATTLDCIIHKLNVLFSNPKARNYINGIFFFSKIKRKMVFFINRTKRAVSIFTRVTCFRCFLTT